MFCKLVRTYNNAKWSIDIAKTFIECSYLSFEFTKKIKRILFKIYSVLICSTFSSNFDLHSCSNFRLNFKIALNLLKQIIANLIIR